MKDFLEKIKGIMKNYRWVIVFLFAVPFFNDVYTGYQIIPDWIMDYLKILAFAALLISMIVCKKKISPLAFVLFLYEMWWFASTLINYPELEGDMLHKSICDIANTLSMALIVEYFKDDPKSLVMGLMLNFELAIYPNFITVILKNIPGDRYYLLGFYAVLILWIMPAICVAVLYMSLWKKYIRASILILISLTTIVMVKCATETVAFLGMIGIIVLGLILFKIKKLQNIKVSLSLFLVLALLLNAFILFAYNGGSFPLVDFIIEKFLGRSTTFTNRVYIWEEAIRMIKEKPIIGHGYRPEVTGSWFSVIHAHNQILQVLNARGIIGLILFAVFHILLCIKVDKSKNTFERLVMVGACFGIFLTYITEAYKKFFRLYLVFFLAYHIDELIRDRINNRDYLFK